VKLAEKGEVAEVGAVQVQVSVDTKPLAEELVAGLLGARLIACGQVLGPIASSYRWRGKVESATEWLVLLKTEDDRADEVVAAIERAHRAEVPEILVTAVAGGSPSYLEWVRGETRQRAASGPAGS